MQGLPKKTKLRHRFVVVPSTICVCQADFRFSLKSKIKATKECSSRISMFLFAIRFGKAK